MKHKVIDTIKVGTNTAVTLEGRGADLKNGLLVKDENGKQYNLLTVALESGNSAENILKTTTVLIQGKFNSKILSVT